MNKGFFSRSKNVHDMFADSEVFDRNQHFDALNTMVVEESLTQSISVSRQSYDGSITISSDISLLFDQNRLAERLTPDNIRKLANRYNPVSSPYTEKMTDDQLMLYIKDKNIQSPSEIRSWSEYLMLESHELLSEANRKTAAAQAEKIRKAEEAAKKSDNLTPVVSPKSE